MEENKPVETKSPFFVDNNFIHERTLMIEGKEYVFGFKELSGFDKDIISKSAINIDPETKSMETMPEVANLKLIMRCMVRAPFDITEENVRNLKAGLKEKILKIINSINQIDEKIIKN